MITTLIDRARNDDTNGCLVVTLLCEASAELELELSTAIENLDPYRVDSIDKRLIFDIETTYNQSIERNDSFPNRHSSPPLDEDKSRYGRPSLLNGDFMLRESNIHPQHLLHGGKNRKHSQRCHIDDTHCDQAFVGVPSR